MRDTIRGLHGITCPGGISILTSTPFAIFGEVVALGHAAADGERDGDDDDADDHEDRDDGCDRNSE